MRFSPHGGSVEEPAPKKFTEIPGARFVAHEALEGEEPLLVVECSPGSTGLREAMTRWLDGSSPVQGVTGGVQDPLPGLDTPPCR